MHTDCIWGFEGLRKLNKIHTGLSQCLPRFHEKINFDQIKFDNHTLKVVIEGSCNTKDLFLTNCNVCIDESFNIDPKIIFKIECIDLSMTWFNNKLLILLNELSKTNMKDTLKKVHILETDTEDEDIEKLFTSCGFTVTISTDLFY